MIVGDLLHHHLVNMEAACCVKDDGVVVLHLGLAHTVDGDVDRVGSWRLSIDRHV